MVPIEYITAGTKDIRDITIAMIVAACIAAMLIATVITAGITRNIRKVSEDLIVWQTEILRYRKRETEKGGEFGKLSEALFHTITRMRSLIMTVAEMKMKSCSPGNVSWRQAAKSMNGRECRIYHGGIWKHEQRHGEYDTGTG